MDLLEIFEHSFSSSDFASDGSPTNNMLISLRFTVEYPPANINKANEEYLGDNSQLLVPAAGLPAVSIPMGFWQNRLPAGIQLAGRPYSEGLLIEIAYGYEQTTYHRMPPPGFPAIP